MIPLWLSPDPLLPHFKRLAEVCPVRDPFLKTMRLRVSTDFREAARIANQRRHEEKLARLAK